MSGQSQNESTVTCPLCNAVQRNVHMSLVEANRRLVATLGEQEKRIAVVEADKPKFIDAQSEIVVQLMGVSAAIDDINRRLATHRI